MVLIAFSGNVDWVRGQVNKYVLWPLGTLNYTINNDKPSRGTKYTAENTSKRSNNAQKSLQRL